MPGPFLPLLKSGIETRVKAIEDEDREILRRLGNVENKAARLDAQSKYQGPTLPQGGGGGTPTAVFAKITAAISAATPSAFGSGTATLADPAAYPAKSYTGASVTVLSNGAGTPVNAEVMVEELADSPGNYGLVVELCS